MCSKGQSPAVLFASILQNNSLLSLRCNVFREDPNLEHFFFKSHTSTPLYLYLCGFSKAIWKVCITATSLHHNSHTTQKGSRPPTHAWDSSSLSLPSSHHKNQNKKNNLSPLTTLKDRCSKYWEVRKFDLWTMCLFTSKSQYTDC